MCQACLLKCYQVYIKEKSQNQRIIEQMTKAITQPRRPSPNNLAPPSPSASSQGLAPATLAFAGLSNLSSFLLQGLPQAASTWKALWSLSIDTLSPAPYVWITPSQAIVPTWVHSLKEAFPEPPHDHPTPHQGSTPSPLLQPSSQLSVTCDVNPMYCYAFKEL